MKSIGISLQVCLILFTYCDKPRSNTATANRLDWEIVRPGQVDLNEKYFNELLTKIEDNIKEVRISTLQKIVEFG